MAASIAVFGGSGGTGQALIAAALGRGVKVRALYRPGSEPRDARAGLDVVTGQLTIPEDVRRTLSGTDGAVLVFGPRLGGFLSKPPAPPEPFCTPATNTIIEEMRRLGIRRLVCQTGAMAGGDSPNWSGFVRRFVRRYRRGFPAIAADRDDQERAVKESDLDWTVVKPFRISRARGTGRVDAAPAVHIGAFTSIRQDDLGGFLLEEVTQGRFHRQAVYAVKG